jgi:anti-sigma factor RsiW
VASILQQLPDDEAVLLMYLADELPPGDRTEVEQRLATDPRLRAVLENLRQAQDVFAAEMPALDRSARLPVPEAVAVRRVVRSMRQWHERRLATPPAAETKPALRYPWWAYPLAAAASVVIAFLVWWGNSDRVSRHYAVSETMIYPEANTSPSDAELLAAFMSLSAPVEEPYATAALVEPSDYAVLMMIDELPGAGVAPGDELKFPDNDIDEDDFFL